MFSLDPRVWERGWVTPTGNQKLISMTGTSTRILEVPTADWDDKRPLEDLREHILTGLDKPVVFHSRINSWSATKQWSPTQVCTLLAKNEEADGVQDLPKEKNS